MIYSSIISRILNHTYYIQEYNVKDTLMEKVNYNPETFFSLSGETIFVTGAAGQLGCSIVNGLIASNANVIATDNDLENLKKCAYKYDWSEEKIILKECDVRKKESILQVFDDCENDFYKITGLINNAGVSVFEPYLERSEESIDFVMDINLKVLYFVYKNLSRKEKI